MNHHLISLSGVFESEGFLPQGGEKFDFRGLEGTCCYCSEEAEEILGRAMPKGGVCWADTGDYHYLSLLRGRLIDRPFELVLIDNHSDDFDLCGLLSCGNWVTQLVREKGCKVKFIRNYADASSQASDLPIFLSLDLDVLREEDFRTNWDQGTMEMNQLLDLLSGLFSTREIVATDICGGLTVSKGAHGRDLGLNRNRREELVKFINGFE